MKLLSVLIIIIFCSIIYPAGITSQRNIPISRYAKKDSLYGPVKETQKEIKKSKLKLGNLFYYDSPFLIQQEFLYYESYKDYSFENNIIGDIQLQNKPLLYQSKLDLSKAMKMNYNFLKKNELGTFGKILVGAVGISAVGLGIYHLIKYKKEYFK